MNVIRSIEEKKIPALGGDDVLYAPGYNHLYQDLYQGGFRMLPTEVGQCGGWFVFGKWIQTTWKYWAKLLFDFELNNLIGK